MSDQDNTCRRCKGSGEVMAMTQEHGPDDYEFAATCPICNGSGVEPPKLTLFICGPSKCDHDYSGFRMLDPMTEGNGGTAVCVKCGADAIAEAMWL